MSACRLRSAFVLLALLLALHPAPAGAATTGTIEGRVTDGATGKALGGVTITVTSPALQGEQSEFSDGGGRYMITDLPPGEYLVRFYYANIHVERAGVFLQADKTLSVSVVMPTQEATVKTYRIEEKAPTVDVGNTQQQTQVTSELVRNTPVRGRGFTDVQTMAPGASAGAGEDTLGKSASVSFNGATGTENSYLIDGVNTTNPAYGLAGTQLTLEFIQETELITGGYNAEYGRATGGVVNVVTKSGSNEFHGDVWLYLTPAQMTPPLIARSGESIGIRNKTRYAVDFGFDLGGPIVKDKVWFYVGFQPTFQENQYVRSLRTRTADNLPSDYTGTSYDGDLAASTGCPSWLDPAFCKVPGFATRDLGSQYTKRYTQTSRLYNWIAKLNFQLDANNRLLLQYIGSPMTVDGVRLGASAASFNAGEGAFLSGTFDNTHDAVTHFVSKLFDRRLQLDLIAGYHYENNKVSLGPQGNQPGVLYAITEPLGIFENIPECNQRMLGAAGNVAFNPCPVLNYIDGGYGNYRHTINQRISASFGATYFARLGGTHALKLGADFEDNIYDNTRAYSGGLYIRMLASGPQIYREYARKIPANGPNGAGMTFPGGFSTTTKTLNYSVYLRDSYNVGFVPGLTVNAGIRWEGQEAYDANGGRGIGIYDNWAPRVGAIYDFTRKGRSKLFASYGRFYESIPLDLNDRKFGGEGSVLGVSLTCTGNKPLGALDPATCTGPDIRNSNINGGQFSLVAPALKGQFSEEVIAGLQYDVGFDTVLGASYIHRSIGRIVEDASPDGGGNYLILNPGDPIDTRAVDDLRRRISSLPADPAECNGQPGPGCPRASAQQQLALYQASAYGFAKPKRNYDAMVLTATKRLSHNFIVLASYTYSRTLGNYPGTFSASNGQLDPNISSQYDLRELLANRDGPLPNDRPHNFKVQGSYFLPMGQKTTFVFGLAFNAYSGVPIEVLGSHPAYGRRETFVLPRGSGGRTPTVTQIDLQLSSRHVLGKGMTLEAYFNTFNLLNQSAVTAVDQEYTTSVVRPIQNGTAGDLVDLKTLAGGAPVLNPNYGHATAYQAPLSLRVGMRLSF